MPLFMCQPHEPSSRQWELSMSNFKAIYSPSLVTFIFWMVSGFKTCTTNNYDCLNRLPVVPPYVYLPSSVLRAFSLAVPSCSECYFHELIDIRCYFLPKLVFFQDRNASNIRQTHSFTGDGRIWAFKNSNRYVP